MVEVTCHVDEARIHPVRVEEVPEHCYLLMRLIKMYEKGNRRGGTGTVREKAVQALMLHPLINSYSLAKELVAAYSRAYGGLFHKA